MSWIVDVCEGLVGFDILNAMDYLYEIIEEWY